MTPYEPYTGVNCPCCGYGETVDFGPLQLHPLDELAGRESPDPATHHLECGRCGARFDARPDCPPFLVEAAS